MIFRKFFIFFVASAIFLFLPEKIWAQVVINEFLPNPSSGSDWVEIYNTGSEAVNLEGWILDDEGTSTNMLEIHNATVSAHGFLSFDVSSRLNKTEDTIYLKNQSSQEIDSYHYGSDPGTDISLGRMPDGGSWGTCQTPTKVSSNSCVVPTPTPVPTDTPESEPTDTPTPTPTPKPPTPIPTKKPTPKPTATPTPTPTGEILEEEATPSGQEPTPTPEVLGETTSNLSDILPKALIGIGALFLLIAGGFLLLPKIKRYNEKDGESQTLE